MKNRYSFHIKNFGVELGWFTDDYAVFELEILKNIPDIRFFTIISLTVFNITVSAHFC